MEKEKGMTYVGTGINYAEMDPFKLLCQQYAALTRGNLTKHALPIFEVEESRGESAYVVDMGPFYLAFVEEGLGTKNEVAREMEESWLKDAIDIARILQRLNGKAPIDLNCLQDEIVNLIPKTYHHQIAQCNFAMIVNDLSTVGAEPFVTMMHLAVGASDYFNNDVRNEAIADGFMHACDMAGCTWGGGETPTLKGIINPGAAVFAGSATGLIYPKTNLLMGSRIEDGDAIILVRSSGVHANGLTLCREIAKKLPDGFFTKLPSGRLYGEALLDPTIIYAPLVNACAEYLHYAVNITGHGWRKLMRAPQKFSYLITSIPEPHEIFNFIQENGPVTDEEAYGNLNMSAGFALYCPEDNVGMVLGIAESLGFEAMVAGKIYAGRREVIIEPKNLVFKEESLQVR